MNKFVRYVRFYLVVVGGIFIVPGVSNSFSDITVPEGFVAEVFAVNLGPVEDFAFDETGVLWVGAGFPGVVTRIEFDETVPLPIDGNTLSPAIIGLDAVFGLAFDQAGNLFLPEFCSGEVTRIDNSLLGGPFPIDVSLIPPLTSGLGCPDGVAFSPTGSPFGTNLFVGDVSLARVLEIDPETGAVIGFTSFSTDIEEVIFSSNGQTMFVISPSGGMVFAVEPGASPTVLAGGFVFPDAIAQGPGNEFGADLYVGDLTGNTLFAVNPITGETNVFADLGSDFEGFEDIIFDQSGRMYILGFGREGQIIRISPFGLVVDLDIKPQSCPNPLNVRAPSRRPEKSKAVLPVAILGTADFDVANIDPTTLMLDGVPALRWNIEDVSTPVSEEAEECECITEGADGHPDLTLKFDKSLIIEALGEIYVGDTISLTINGELTDGTPFEGTDCVVIVGGPPPAAGAPPSRESPDVVLIGNFPNPFNPTTEISFSLPTASHVKLEIFNIMGQKVATLVDGHLEAGEHIVQWDGSEAASGVYLYRLQADDFVDTKKMILLK